MAAQKVPVLDISGSQAGRARSEINVTPLVDVVLVLLIIFLVVTPLVGKTFWVHLPKQEKEEVEPDRLEDEPPPLVMKVGADRTVQVNGVEIALAEFPERLKRMFAARDDHILFFDADDGAAYGFAVEALDLAREGGAVTIAPLVQPAGQPAAAEPGPASAGAPPAAADPPASPATTP